MSIRIDSLEPKFSSAEPPQMQWESCPEMAHIYGGTIASAALPTISTPLPAAPLPRPSPPRSTENWSTALQTMLDRPPSALPHRLVLGGIVFCAAFVTWASTSQIDEIGRAQGRLIPQGALFKVHPIAAGKVSKLLVREGQQVKAGQVIAELDNDLVLNRLESLKQDGKSLEKELSETEMLIHKTRLEEQTRRSIALADLTAQEATIVQSQAKIKGQQTMIAQMQQRSTTSQVLLGELEADAAAQKERMSRLEHLVKEGALAQEQLYQAQQLLGERQRTITQQTGETQQSITEAQRLQSDLQQAIAEQARMQAQLAQKQAEAQNTQLQAQQTVQQLLVQRTQLLAKIQQNIKLQEQAKTQLQQLVLRAPIEGEILSLNLHNQGEVVQPGQTIAELAPKTAPLVLVAALPTREAGFVKVGNTAQLKFDAFPYQDYGIVTGKVLSISPDAKLDERLGAVYRVEIGLERSSVSDRAQKIALKSGQTASAEIVVRRRAIAQMLLDPIRQLQKNGLKL